mmetsp:Transcript_96391/g.267769  ORF Transcript_96391/g.267769 Transcript_96391/m.267769 type:complete len:222 (+) Transcript_96391:1782-2447(+)
MLLVLALRRSCSFVSRTNSARVLCCCWTCRLNAPPVGLQTDCRLAHLSVFTLLRGLVAGQSGPSPIVSLTSDPVWLVKLTARLGGCGLGAAACKASDHRQREGSGKASESGTPASPLPSVAHSREGCSGCSRAEGPPEAACWGAASTGTASVAARGRGGPGDQASRNRRSSSRSSPRTCETMSGRSCFRVSTAKRRSSSRRSSRVRGCGLAIARQSGRRPT